MSTVRAPTHEAIAALGMGRISSDSTFVSKNGTAATSIEPWRFAHRPARWQFEFHAAVGREALVDESDQILRLG
ncbi:MAG: hypothetical protein OXD29_15220 [Roseovarius sp.]|nr:hypothetical protein [Roseovarius sp.]